MRRNFSVHVVGGLSRGSHVRRPWSKDPHRLEGKCHYISDFFSVFCNPNFGHIFGLPFDLEYNGGKIFGLTFDLEYNGGKIFGLAFDLEEIGGKMFGLTFDLE